MEIVIPEVSFVSAGLTGLYVYGILGAAMTIIMIISTFITCQKVNFISTALVGLTISIAPAVIYAITLKFEFFKKPFASVFQMMGLSPDRSMFFGGTYLVLLVLLPLVIYGVHSAEESVCVASASEMTAFKTKMMKELQEKQEAEEKNEKKK